MNKELEEVVTKFVEHELGHERSGHGLDHAIRVKNNALKIARWHYKNNNLDGEPDYDVIGASALLHDTIDDKLFTDVDKQKHKVFDFIIGLNMTRAQKDEIVKIITHMSFRYNFTFEYLEGQIVQDADLLDSIGVIGIARTFMFTGAMRNGCINDVIEHYDDRLSKVFDRLNLNTSKNYALFDKEHMDTFFRMLRTQIKKEK